MSFQYDDRVYSMNLQNGNLFLIFKFFAPAKAGTRRGTGPKFPRLEKCRCFRRNDNVRNLLDLSIVDNFFSLHEYK